MNKGELNTPLNPNALGGAMALIGALFMLLISLVALAGYGQEAVRIMQAYHIGYDLTFLGIIAGILGGGVMGYLGGLLTAIFYNKFA